MKQLTGLDASFLNMETGTTFGHVSSVSIFERPEDPDYNPYESFRAQMESRLHLLEPYRRRLVEVPLSLDHPYWIRDPDFDLDFHIRHMALPAPGNADQLGEQVARIVGRPMDRSRPLWEVYVIEGLESGDFAVLQKVHHATIDGASGVEAMAILLDTVRVGAVSPEDPGTWSPEAMPTATEMLNRTAAVYLRRPQKMLKAQLRLLREIAKITRNKGLENTLTTIRRAIPLGGTPEQRDTADTLPTLAAPPTPFNKAITAHRRFAFRSVPLEDIKTIKTRLGATVNDVVMAVCAGALRRYLEKHSALTSDPLIAMVPVSIRTGQEEEKWTNRVSGIFAKLPTNVESAVERVGAVHESMAIAKENFDLIPADLLVDFAEFAPPAVATRAMRMATSTRMPDRLKPPMNVVISNVPGPRHPLYLAGAQLKHYYPVSTIVDGQGLNITVQSYIDTLDFGLISCRELVPDLWELVDMCVDEVDQLLRETDPSAPKSTGSKSSDKSSGRSTAEPSKKTAVKRPATRAKGAAAKQAGPKKTLGTVGAPKKVAPVKKVGAANAATPAKRGGAGSTGPVGGAAKTAGTAKKLGAAKKTGRN